MNMHPTRSGHHPISLARHASTLLIVLATPLAAHAQAAPPAAYTLDDTTQRPELETPMWVQELERTHGVPPCGEERYWGRSTLDGGLASRLRPDDLPCRSVWDETVRLELGLHAGGMLERSEGAMGGFSLQVGLRFHELFSVYYQGHLLGGGWDRDGGQTAEATNWNAFMLEVRPHRVFGVALGPSFDITGSCDFGVGQEPDECTYAWSYGVGSRLTFALTDDQSAGPGVVATGDFHVSLIEPDAHAVGLVGIGLRL